MTYHFVKDGRIIIDVLDGDLKRTHVIQLWLSIVSSENCEISLLFPGGLIPVEDLGRLDETRRTVDLEFQPLVRSGHETVRNST